MAELSIKVNIANRVYPLKINFSEEENIRKAAKLINEKMKEYEENFSVKDKQDLLAMAALQYANEALGSTGKFSEDQNSLIEDLNEIDTLVNSHLEKIAG